MYEKFLFKFFFFFWNLDKKINIQKNEGQSTQKFLHSKENIFLH